MRITGAIVAIGLASSAFMLQADQTSFNVGTSSAPWLNIEASPRVAALAGQGCALEGDALVALSDNPAGLAGLKGQSLQAAEDTWIQDTSLQHAAYGLGLGQAGGLGLGFTYMNYGSLDNYTVLGGGTLQQDGSTNPYGYAAKLGYGLALGQHLSAGLIAKYVGESIADDSSSAFTVDVGLLAKAGALSVGLSGSNLFGTLHDSSLPAELKASAGYDLSLSPSNQVKLLAGGSLPTADSSAMSAGGGLEYGYAQTLWGRLGYLWQGNGIGGGSGLSAGAGLKYGLLSLDYAYVALGELGAGNQVSLKVEF